MLSATQLIDLLQLEPLPHEGGYFRRTYLAEDRITAEGLPERYGRSMPISSCIYYLITPKNFSTMHRLQTDEIYHFYYGDPMELLLLYPNGDGEIVRLGTDFGAGMRPQLVVPRDVWQGSIIQPNGTFGYALIGTTMAPGYDNESFELGIKDQLLALYPDFAEEINGRF